MTDSAILWQCCVSIGETVSLLMTPGVSGARPAVEHRYEDKVGIRVIVYSTDAFLCVL